MQITTLIENKNSNPDKFVAEHGLSIYIQKEDINILFDTGATGIFVENARKLGVDLSGVDMAVISHGHYDHGGGLEAFLDENKTAPVYLKEGADEGYFAKLFFLMKKPASLDKKLLNENKGRFKFISENTEIGRDIILITHINKDYPVPPGNKYLYKELNGKLERDDFQHELMMVIKDQDELVLFTGCAHNGILNMVDTVRDLFPDYKIKALFGGFHLIGITRLDISAPSNSQIKELGQKLMEYPIGKIYTGHCTGERAYNILKGVMGDRLDYFSTGKIIEI